MGDVKPLRRLRSVPKTDQETSAADNTEERDRAITSSLRAAGRGDESAFQTFYELMSPLVYGIGLKVLRDPAIAEEVAQEVFVELWRLAPRFDAERGSAKSWSATIAHRRAVDRVRSEQAHRRRTEREGHKASIAHDDTVESVVERFEVTQVRQALDLLNDAQREAVTLAYYGGHTYREVAVLLDTPEGTVKTRIRDGLIKLRDHLEVTP
jgi:RNA polymerase sigma-70 factor (ECF subfamily)